MDIREELALMAEADRRAADYIGSVEARRAFPSASDIQGLSALSTPLPQEPSDPMQMLKLIDEVGGPGTVASNGPNYYGFVIGATLPAAAAAERLGAAWDQCASSFVNSPAMAVIEETAAKWLLEALDLPRTAGVGFGTSATACGLACLATARTGLLSRLGWDIAKRGLAGAPAVRVVVSETVHVTVKKALRLLGVGSDNVLTAPTDEHGRVIPEDLPTLDDRTILCLQAGEVNTGEFDPFADIMKNARLSGCWVHVDRHLLSTRHAHRSNIHTIVNI